MARRVVTPAVACDDLTVGYAGKDVLFRLDLDVAADEVVAILGPSGSGKSTLLHAVAGFVHPTSGTVRIGGRVVADHRRAVAPHERDVALVFQHYALWPHLTALETVAYPLRRQGATVEEARADAAALLERMGMSALAQRRPTELSGGEQQRVGLARALARRASVYLFDEPTSALDAPLRASLQAELAGRRREAGAAAVYATHDAAEALAIADRVGLLRDGRLVQLDTPARIYSEPVDLWAARLTGPASVLSAPAEATEAGAATLCVDGVVVQVPAAGASLDSGALLVRPEWTTLGGPLGGVVTWAAYRGPHTDYRLATSVGHVEVRGTGPPVARAGQRVDWTLHRVCWVASGPE